MDMLTLVRYEFELSNGKERLQTGLFRIPQALDTLSDEDYELYEEFYKELPCPDVAGIYCFTLYGEKIQGECRYVSSTSKAVPSEYEVKLTRKLIEVPTDHFSILYRDDYQVALSSLEFVTEQKAS